MCCDCRAKPHKPRYCLHLNTASVCFDQFKGNEHQSEALQEGFQDVNQNKLINKCFNLKFENAVLNQMAALMQITLTWLLTCGVFTAPVMQLCTTENMTLFEQLLVLAFPTRRPQVRSHRVRNNLAMLWNDVKISSLEDKMASKVVIRLIATIEGLQNSPACTVCSVQQSHEL